MTTRPPSGLLVACYAIGWRITEEDLRQYPHLRMASGEDDTGVIISFNSEAESVQDSLLIPAGHAIAGHQPAQLANRCDPCLQAGESGRVLSRLQRGDRHGDSPSDRGLYRPCARQPEGARRIARGLPPGLSLFSEGVYHLYDYQFFYRSLQENVAVRLNAYLRAHAAR